MPRYILDTFRNFSLRSVSLLCLLVIGFYGNSQDTLTVEQLDFKFFSIDGGRISPLSSLGETSVAGLFLPCAERDLLKFCGPNDFFIWVDGRYFGSSDSTGCLHVYPQELCEYTRRDTAFISVVANSNLIGNTARSVVLSTDESQELLMPMRRTASVSERWYLGFIVCGVLLFLLRFISSTGIFTVPNQVEQTSRCAAHHFIGFSGCGCGFGIVV